jgi:adenosine deaminase
MTYNPIWHIHGDGSIPADKLFEFATKQAAKKKEPLLKPEFNDFGEKIEYASDEDRLVKSVSCAESVMYDLKKYGFGGAFGFAVNSMQDEEGIREGVRLYFNYLASQNITHAETHYAPELHTKQGLSLDDVLTIMTDSFKNEIQRTKIKAGIISGINRMSESEKGVEVAEATLKAHEKNPDIVIALGLVCGEVGFPPLRHYPAFEMTFNTTLKRDIHAGEQLNLDNDNLDNIRSSVYTLKAHGVDHAIPVHQDKILCEYMVEHKVRVASNPLSNLYFFGVEEKRVNLSKVVAHRLLVGHNPDDPCMIKPSGHQTDVENYIRSKYQGMWGEQLMTKLKHNLVLGSWLISKEQKTAYYQTHKNEIMVGPNNF